MLPKANCRVVKVERHGGTAATGFREDYDRPATDPEGDPGKGGDDVWTGNVAGRYEEKRERVTGQTRNLIVRRWIVVDAVEPSIDVQAEDTITWTVTRRGSTTTISAKVEAVEETDDPGLPGTTRVTLTPS